MSSTFLRALAVILAIGALAMAWFGYRINSKPPVASVEAVTPTYPQVIAAQDIPIGKVLTAGDVKLISTPQKNFRGYASVHDVLGKLTVEPIAKGMPLVSKHFPAVGLLARSLAPNERAIAVKVNEVIGVGGFVKPGDRVDVLLYLRADRETDNVSSAQIVLSDVKVLAYGDVLSEETDTEKQLDDSGRQADAAVSEKAGKLETKKEKNSRSAILAVPENQVSRLMLAESSGLLRLALRGAQPLDVAKTGTNQFIRLDDVARPRADQVAKTGVTTAMEGSISPSEKKNGSTVSKRDRVIVHRGEQVEVINITR